MKVKIFIATIFISFFSIAQQQKSISVAGTATKIVKANQLILTMGINLNGTDAKQIFENSSKIYTKGLDFLKLQKKYCTYQTDIVKLISRKEYNSAKVSFESKQTIEIIITDFSAYSDIINGLLNVGFNTITNTRFMYSQPDVLKEQVRNDAIAVAVKKAKNTAKQLDVVLGTLISFSEENQGARPMYLSNSFSRQVGKTNNVQHAMEPGDFTISVTVFVVYSIETATIFKN